VSAVVAVVEMAGHKKGEKGFFLLFLLPFLLLLRLPQGGPPLPVLQGLPLPAAAAVAVVAATEVVAGGSDNERAYLKQRAAVGVVR